MIFQDYNLFFYKLLCICCFITTNILIANSQPSPLVFILVGEEPIFRDQTLAERQFYDIKEALASVEFYETNGVPRNNIFILNYQGMRKDERIEFEEELRRGGRSCKCVCVCFCV